MELWIKMCSSSNPRPNLVCFISQNWPNDTTKIRNVLGGWLYAYELPSEALLPTVRRSDSPDELVRQEKLQQVKRQRTLSLKEIKNSRAKAAKVWDKLMREGLRGGKAETAEEEGVGLQETAKTAEEGEGLRGGTGGSEEKLTREPLRGGRGEVAEEDSGVVAAKRRRVEAEEPGSEVNGASRLTEEREGGVAAPGDPEGGARGNEGMEDMDVQRLDSDERSNSLALSTSLQQPYLYAVHRRMVSVQLSYMSHHMYQITIEPPYMEHMPHACACLMSLQQDHH